MFQLKQIGSSVQDITIRDFILEIRVLKKKVCALSIELIKSTNQRSKNGYFEVTILKIVEVYGSICIPIM